MTKRLGMVILAALLVFTTSESFAYARKIKSRFRHKVISTPEGNIVQEDGKNVLYKKRNVVDFDATLIEGDVKNPSEFYFVHRPEEKFGTLVKKRKNFHKEMLRDTVMIR